MKHFFKLILIIGFGALIGGIYGIIHDQLTYTISPEYYTKFKFQQFGLYWLGANVETENAIEIIPTIPRLGVALIGFMATWWVGLFIRLLLGLVALTIKDSKQILRSTVRAFLLAITIASAVGLIGLFLGKLFLSELNIKWYLPENIIDKRNFIAVGAMHSFSYVGGAIGLLVGIIYLLSKRKKLNSYATLAKT